MPQPPHHPTAFHQHPVNHPTKPLWTVVRQELNTRYVPGSDPVQEWTVHYMTRSGVQSQVTIPREVYSADAVAAAVQPEAELLDSIAQLNEHTKPTHP